MTACHRISLQTCLPSAILIWEASNVWKYLWSIKRCGALVDTLQLHERAAGGFLGLDQGPDKALLQTSSLKHNTTSCWAMAGLIGWGPPEAAVSPLHLQQQATHTAPLDPQLQSSCSSKAPGCCFTASDLPSAPSRCECQPFPWETAKGALLGPFSIACGVCFAPPHTVFQVFSWAEASAACSYYQKPKSCPHAAQYWRLSSIMRLTHGLITHKVRRLYALNINWA